MSAVFIVRRVLARPTVTVQSIYGAISAYLIVGLMFAAFYAAMWHLGVSPFFASGQSASPQTFQYFSFTTLTTLGYGDFVAVNNGGRAVAVIEALAGQVFLATLVARLVAAFRGRRSGAAPPQPGAGRRGACAAPRPRRTAGGPREGPPGTHPGPGPARPFAAMRSNGRAPRSGL